MCNAVEKGIGQPCGLKFLIEEGCAPSCSEYISASSPVKSGSGIFFARKGKKIFRSRAKRRVLTGCGRSDSSCCAGTGRGTGFSGPNKEWQGRKEERGFAGGAKGDFTPGFQRYGQFRFNKGELLQAPARRSSGGMDFGPLWGRKTNTGVFLSF